MTKKTLFFKFSVLVFTTIVFVLTLHGISHAQTFTHIYVDAVNGTNAPTGRGSAAKPYQSITFALLLSTRNNLPDPWHVHIRPGTYDADLAKPANAREIFPLKLRRAMIFEGTTTAEECVIDGRHTGASVVPILHGEDTEGVTIRNLTIQNMYRTDGGVGGIILHDSTGTKETPSTLEGCIVHNNKAGGVSSSMPLILTGNTFSSNGGTGARINRSTAATNNIFSGNAIGGLYITDSNGDISENTFQNNQISGLAVAGTLRGNVAHNTFNNNSSNSGRIGGGGFRVKNFTGNVTHNTFNNNNSDRGSGGGFNVGNFTGNVTHNTFNNNNSVNAGSGGGFLVNDFTGNVTHNTFNNNSSNNGGGFLVSHFTGNVTHNAFNNNNSDLGGGGFDVEYFTGNVTHNIFDSNSGRRSGGFYLHASTTNTVEVFNNIFFNNTTRATARETGGSVVTRHATHFMNNLFMISDELSEGVSGAPTIWVSSPQCRFHNNIFSGVKTAIYTDGTFDLPITHNLFHDVKADFVEQAGNNLGNDLLFWELVAVNATNNLEGAPLLVDPVPLRDFHLQAASPAINAGTNQFAPSDDFDGVARPVGETVDIGPYEYGGKPAQTDDKEPPETDDKEPPVNRTPQTLEIVSGVDQKGSINTALANPFVVKVRDGSGSAFAGVAVTFAITAGGGSLSIESATTDADGRAESTLTLGPDVGTNTVSVSVSGIQQTITFTAVSTPPETSLLVVEGTITHTDGSPTEAGLPVTVTIGSITQTAVSAAGGNYKVTFINLAGVVASSLDTVEVQVLREVTGESAEKTVQLSSEQIIAQRATIDLQFLPPTAAEYLLSVPSGISLIHVPLKVTAVDDMPQTIESIADLYDALGGAAFVNFLITYDPETGKWFAYSGTRDNNTPADKALADDTGIIAVMKNAVTLRLEGNPLGTDGNSTITLNRGINLVGVPLQAPNITRVSDLFAIEGIAGNVGSIIVSDNGTFRAVGQAGDAGDNPITGGQAFILTARQATTVAISGAGWTNVSGTAAAPPMTIMGIEVGEKTPVLALRGAIVDDGISLNKQGFRVTVKNLSTDRAVTAVKAPDEAGYRLTVVDIETGRAATIGDTLEISAQSPNPFLGVQPLRYTVTAEDVKRSLIQLPELVVYEIPAETELLHNYPNPFNPETWIPYRLAEDAFVTLIIYDRSGRVVRTLEVGHRIAAVYESRSKAIYWDGRNEFGESVASGVYFYHLSAGDYSATRKMLILK